MNLDCMVTDHKPSLYAPNPLYLFPVEAGKIVMSSCKSTVGYTVVWLSIKEKRKLIRCREAPLRWE